MKSKIQLLFPRPRHCEELPETVSLSSHVRIGVEPAARGFAVDRLRSTLEQRGLSIALEQATAAVEVRVVIAPELEIRAQGYELEIANGRISIRAKDQAGLFYAVATLEQLLALHRNGDDAVRLPGVRIQDYPDFPNRGVMLDISRDKVPTLETVCSLVDMLASWKINQFQLYMEHTFAYAGHEVVWREASPFTPAEIRELDTFCRERSVDLVPNQNSFGHMHRWVTLQPYNSFAECPNGFEHAWHSGEPYSLCAVDPRSLALIDDLYDQLLPNFGSKLFNVGCDETIDLGLGGSAEACKEHGTARVYLDFLKKIHERVSARGRRMLFWGDIIIKSPELIPELPKDAIALEWGYEADHPFSEHVERFAASNLEFYVCPGTSSWNTIAGRTENAVFNICRAVRAGVEHGASGCLITDWGDNGHMQPLPVSYLGYLVGAGVSWNAADAVDPAALDIPALLDAHAYRDKAGRMGRLAFDIGNAYKIVGGTNFNGSTLFYILNYSHKPFKFEGVTLETLGRAREYLYQLSEPGDAHLERADAALIADEFSWAIDILRFSCDLGIARLEAGPERALGEIASSVREPLARQLSGLVERHRANWLRRNRPGGLQDSARRLEKVLRSLMDGI